ncbi:MAG: MarC family protein [Thermomicrobiales bacterium]
MHSDTIILVTMLATIASVPLWLAFIVRGAWLREHHAGGDIATTAFAILGAMVMLAATAALAGLVLYGLQASQRSFTTVALARVGQAGFGIVAVIIAIQAIRHPGDVSHHLSLDTEGASSTPQDTVKEGMRILQRANPIALVAAGAIGATIFADRSEAMPLAKDVGAALAGFALPLVLMLAIGVAMPTTGIRLRGIEALPRVTIATLGFLTALLLIPQVFSNPGVLGGGRMDGPETVLFLTSLIAIINPISSLALFSTTTASYPATVQQEIALRSTVAVAIVLIAMAWIGQLLLRALGISVPMLQAAGGIIVLRQGLAMVSATGSANEKSDVAEASDEQSWRAIAIVPIAIPFTVGAGSIATVIAQSSTATSILDVLIVSAVCLLAAGVCYVAFRFAAPVSAALGPAGMGILTRMMGIVVTAIGFGLLARGLGGLLPGLMG